jgi:hypothetical protein
MNQENYAADPFTPHAIFLHAEYWDVDLSDLPKQSANFHLSRFCGTDITFRGSGFARHPIAADPDAALITGIPQVRRVSVHVGRSGLLLHHIPSRLTS